MGLTDKYEHTYRHAQPETECPGRCDAIQRYEQIATSSFNLWKMPKPVAEKLHTVTRWWLEEGDSEGKLPCVPREIAAVVDRAKLAGCMGLTDSTKRC